MKAYIQIDSEGEFHNVNAYVAWVGLKALGFEIEKFEDANSIVNPDKSSILVGGIGAVRKHLTNLNLPIPAEIEYPIQLKSYLNRKVWKAKLNDLIADQTVNIFIKPVSTKLFTGKVIRSFNDYIGFNPNEELEVWCSEIVNIVTEWRCFIRYGEIFEIRYYKGTWDSKIDLAIVNEMIAKYATQPAAFSLDIGLDDTGKHYLIEVNDGHSLGTYGIGPITYAKFLSARWAEMTGTEDWLRF